MRVIKEGVEFTQWRGEVTCGRNMISPGCGARLEVLPNDLTISSVSKSGIGQLDEETPDYLATVVCPLCDNIINVTDVPAVLLHRLYNKRRKFFDQATGPN